MPLRIPVFQAPVMQPSSPQSPRSKLEKKKSLRRMKLGEAKREKLAAKYASHNGLSGNVATKSRLRKLWCVINMKDDTWDVCRTL